MSLALLGLRSYIKKNYRPDPETNIMSAETYRRIVYIVSFVLKFQLIANVCFDTYMLPNQTIKAIV